MCTLDKFLVSSQISFITNRIFGVQIRWGKYSKKYLLKFYIFYAMADILTSEHEGNHKISHVHWLKYQPLMNWVKYNLDEQRRVLQVVDISTSERLVEVQKLG